MKIIDNRELTKQKAREFIKNLNHDVYIIGRNKYSISLIKWLESLDKKIIGYIDDFTDLKSFNDYPIYKSSNSYINTSIINCVVEGRTSDVNRLVNSLKPISNIDYFALQFGFSELLAPIDFLSDTNSIIEKFDSYSKLYFKLHDQQSKDEFEALSNFRLNRDISFLNCFKYKLHEQYFENFIELIENPSFIDGGGFDGASSLQFIQKFPKYKKIYYFEPSKESMRKSRLNLAHKDEIEFFQNGLWNIEATLNFDNTHGSASALNVYGPEIIETVTIDQIITDGIDYIKLDIEGAEIEAIKGGKNTIMNYRPKLAICVYHKQNDFIEVPSLISEMNLDYKIILRHYSQGIFETVMYFV